MRTVRTKVYQFSELSEPAKKKAIEWYLKDEDFSHLYGEAEKTLLAFCRVFSIDIAQFDFEEQYRSKYYFNLDENVLELSGQRLATYIWNNYKTDLFKGKYFSLWSKTEKSYKYHKEGYPVLKSRYSKVILSNSCVLTGMCYDDDMLQPIYDFLNKPTNTDFKYLLEDCLSELCKSVCGEVRASATDEAVAETIEANEYEFTKDGNVF